MEYIIGGYINKLIIDTAINYFENRFSESFDFEGIIENRYFLGVIKDKSNNSSNTLMHESKLFRSIYSTQVFKNLKENKKNLNDFLSNISQDFIYCIYDKNKGIKVFVDKFTRQKIYYTIKPPFLFSSSLKFLFNVYDKKLINYEVLGRLLGYGVNIGNETLFFYINRLDVGEYLRISKNNLIIDNYWIINKEFFNNLNNINKDLSFWIDYLYNTFKAAINWPKQESYISLLSGGIDSTVLTSILVKEFNMPIEAITIKITNYNERDVNRASIVAEDLDIPLKIIELKDENLKIFSNHYSKIFNILEEPVCASSYLSRYHAFNEVKKLGKKAILLGDGGDDALGYLKPEIIKYLEKIRYIYKIPSKFKYYVMKFGQKIRTLSSSLINHTKNQNIIRFFDIIINTNFLLSQNDLQSFFTTFQLLNFDDISKMINYKMDLNSFLKPITKECLSYPFNDLNKISYHRMMAIVNGDFFVNTNITNILDLKHYTFVSNDIFWKNFIPLPVSIKLMGHRDRWIIYEMARKKKLLPEAFFKDKSYYGFHQIFEEKKSFENVKAYLKNLMYLKEDKSLIPLRPFKKHLDISYNNFKKYSHDYRQFSVVLGFLGWLLSIV